MLRQIRRIRRIILIILNKNNKYYSSYMHFKMIRTFILVEFFIKKYIDKEL
jgi:hypothetical protein